MRVNWLPFVPMDTQDRIVIDPNICHGKPVIRAVRVCLSRWLSEAWLAG